MGAEAWAARLYASVVDVGYALSAIGIFVLIAYAIYRCSRWLMFAARRIWSHIRYG